MNYIKYIIPIFLAVVLSLVPSFVNVNQTWTLILGAVVKGGLLIYFLRLNNNNTPFINTLTILLILMMLGEYLISYNYIMAQVITFFSNTAFITIFFLRAKSKANSDNLAFLKSLSVAAFGIGNMIYISTNENLVLLIIGNLFMAGIYLYDRLLREGEKNTNSIN